MVKTDSHKLEHCYQAIGTNYLDRYAFLAFMLRILSVQQTIRRISTRYKHRKKVSHYEN